MRTSLQGGMLGTARAQAALAYEEAHGVIGGGVTALLMATPFLVAPYLAGLAADSTGRVASDVAYLAAMLAVHGLGMTFGVLVPPLRGALSDVWLARGASPFLMTWGRSLGVSAWALAPAVLVTMAAVGAASACGASDAGRIWIVPAGFPVTFGLAALLASHLPRVGALFATAFLLVVGHLLDAGAADPGSWFGILDAWTPSFGAWDAWPGEVLTMTDWVRRAAYGMLFGMSLVCAAAIVAGWTTFSRRAARPVQVRPGR